MTIARHTYSPREVGFFVEAALSPSSAATVEWNDNGGEVEIYYTDDPLLTLRALTTWTKFTKPGSSGSTVLPLGTRKAAIECTSHDPDDPSVGVIVQDSVTNMEQARIYGVDQLDSPVTVSPADYPALVLADMGASFGSFFEMQDGTISPLTDTGPDASVDMIAKDPGITSEIDGPWPGSKALFNDDGIEFRDWTENSDMFDSNISGTYEGWYKVSSTGSQTFNLMLSDDGGRLQMSNSIGPIKQGQIDGSGIPQPPDWVALTVYAQGDRVSDPGLPGNVFEAEVAGTSDAAEPTWPALNLTVVDGTVTWRNAGNRLSWHDSGVFTGGFTPTLDEWFHIAFTRDATGFKVYINGVHDSAMDVLVAADNTTPGSFGTPKKFALSADYSPGSGTQTSGSGFAIGASGVDGEEQWHGGVAFVAVHHTALTQAKIQAHYDLGVALGLNT